MKYRASLRNRVTLSFALLGLLVSVALAVGLYLLVTITEYNLVTDTIAAELDDYIERYRLDPATVPPSGTRISIFVSKPANPDLPPALARLPAGMHRVLVEGVDYYAAVRMQEGIRFILLYDSRQIMQREHYFIAYLVAAVVIMTCLSAILGYWLSGRVMSPICELVKRVAGLQPHDDDQVLATDFPDDEVGMLAREFDAYQRRLSEFIEREQYFTADVSHELRTPLTVIEGAADILLDNLDEDSVSYRPLQRIRRSVRDMSQMVEALLILAREHSGYSTVDGCDVAEALRQVVQDHTHLLNHKPVEIKLDIRADILLPVECSLLRIVLSNVLRNAIHFTDKGVITLLLDQHGLSIKDTGVGIPPNQMQLIFDRHYKGREGGEGIGLSLVRRICQRHGWCIQIDSTELQGTELRIQFNGTDSI